MTELPTPRQRIEAALRLGRALRLVGRAAPGWTLANLALVLVQGALPLAALYVMKRILDAVAAAVGTPGRPELAQTVWLWILVAGGVALVIALTRLLGEYATEAHALQVTDSVAGILHAQSGLVDASGLAYKVTPMGTVVEGTWDEVFRLIKRCHRITLQQEERVLTTIRIDDRKGATDRIDAKVRSVEKKLGKVLKK